MGAGVAGLLEYRGMGGHGPWRLPEVLVQRRNGWGPGKVKETA